MKPRMSAKRAIRVWERGPKTEAQRTQALAALRHLGLDMVRDYPEHHETAAWIKATRAKLEAAPLRGQS